MAGCPGEHEAMWDRGGLCPEHGARYAYLVNTKKTRAAPGQQAAAEASMEPQGPGTEALEGLPYPGTDNSGTGAAEEQQGGKGAEAGASTSSSTTSQPGEQREPRRSWGGPAAGATRTGLGSSQDPEQDAATLFLCPRPPAETSSQHPPRVGKQGGMQG